MTYRTKTEIDSTRCAYSRRRCQASFTKTFVATRSILEPRTRCGLGASGPKRRSKPRWHIDSYMLASLIRWKLQTQLRTSLNHRAARPRAQTLQSRKEWMGYTLGPSSAQVGHERWSWPPARLGLTPPKLARSAL